MKEKKAKKCTYVMVDGKRVRRVKMQFSAGEDVVASVESLLVEFTQAAGKPVPFSEIRRAIFEAGLALILARAPGSRQRAAVVKMIVRAARPPALHGDG